MQTLHQLSRLLFPLLQHVWHSYDVAEQWSSTSWRRSDYRKRSSWSVTQPTGQTTSALMNIRRSTTWSVLYSVPTLLSVFTLSTMDVLRASLSWHRVSTRAALVQRSAPQSSSHLRLCAVTRGVTSSTLPWILLVNYRKCTAHAWWTCSCRASPGCWRWEKLDSSSLRAYRMLERSPDFPDTSATTSCTRKQEMLLNLR